MTSMSPWSCIVALQGTARIAFGGQMHGLQSMPVGEGVSLAEPPAVHRISEVCFLRCHLFVVVWTKDNSLLFQKYPKFPALLL